MRCRSCEVRAATDNFLRNNFLRKTVRLRDKVRLSRARTRSESVEC